MLHLLDPTHTLIKHRLYRDSCLDVTGIYVKDLNVLGRNLAHTIIVDNCFHCFFYQAPITPSLSTSSTTES